jgi:hypothetical protein
MVDVESRRSLKHFRKQGTVIINFEEKVPEAVIPKDNADRQILI